MPEPRVVDLRHGLTQAVLDDLRGARRVVLMPKGNHTAALGYWVEEHGEEQLRIALFGSEGLPWIRVPPQPLTPVLSAGAVVRPVGRAHRFVRGVLMDIHSPQDDEFWTRFISLLRPGDLLRLGVDPVTARRPVLRVSNGRTIFAVINVPRASQSRSSPAA
jgi:hypothetical protein